MGKKQLNKQIALLEQQSKELDIIQAEVAEKKAKEEEAKRKEEEANRKPYVVYGSEITVLNPNIVEFYKNRFEMMVSEYKLVGKFRDDGTYTIANEIKYDLIEMKKEIEEVADEYYKASALYMRKYFNFTVKLTMLEDGKAKASLYIAEYIGKNFDEEFISSHVADFVDVFDAEYRIKLRKAFNLVDADAKNNDFDIPNLAVLMQNLFDLDAYVGDLYDMASQIYVIRMIKLLENGGPVEQEVLKIYKQLVKEMEEDEEEDEKIGKKKSSHKNERLKELLDKSIDKVGGFEKLSIDPAERDKIIKDLNKTDALITKVSKGGILEINNTSDSTKKALNNASSNKGPNKGKNKKKPDKKADKDKKGDNKKTPKLKKDEKKETKGGGADYHSPTFTYDNSIETNIDIIEELLNDEEEKEAENRYTSSAPRLRKENPEDETEEKPTPIDEDEEDEEEEEEVEEEEEIAEEEETAEEELLDKTEVSSAEDQEDSLDDAMENLYESSKTENLNEENNLSLDDPIEENSEMSLDEI